MCQCDSSSMLFTPACDYIWAVARWDAGDRLWRLTVDHTHSGRRLQDVPDVASFIASDAASQWLCTVVGGLLMTEELAHAEWVRWAALQGQERERTL